MTQDSTFVDRLNAFHAVHPFWATVLLVAFLYWCGAVVMLPLRIGFLRDDMSAIRKAMEGKK